MHTVGLHSALAIKRQRKRREELKKARERRFSSQSTESGLGGSRSSCNSPGSFGGSTDRLRSSHRKNKVAVPGLQDTNVVSHIGMLHIGIVFLVLGMFLIGSGIIPDDYTSWDKTINWWNELILTGITAMIIGLFLIILNHYLSQKEEDELSRYVERQLTRSRSGKRLIKDEETGCLTTKTDKRVKEKATVETEVHHSYPYPPALKSPTGGLVQISTPKSDLERILEEETSEERVDIESFPMESLRTKGAQVNGDVSPNRIEPARELVVTRVYRSEEINMIGAMPAVAVRHERRRAEKRSKRPSLLYLQSTQSRSTSPSPVQSSPGLYSTPQLEIYILGRISLLHIAVVTMLAGAVTLFVGLVQLKPGAEASQYRYVLIGSGLVFTLLGTLLAVIRCCLLPWVAKRRERQRHDRHRKQREHKTTEKLSPAKTTTDSKTEGSNPEPQPTAVTAIDSSTIGSSV